MRATIQACMHRGPEQVKMTDCSNAMAIALLEKRDTQSHVACKSQKQATLVSLLAWEGGLVGLGFFFSMSTKRERERFSR
ncbi:hypothetical protein BCV70DRAFT_45350 [Testicularia cyperi]|uniref:Uncharacterized protein n=1 Tax=Testicularia cyperi TaxID=1882483 RepID=A0A317XHZ1_9BASI|nr:hypothetical protein BCV70DRAFT_45350 [Testicularia cyperi]